MKTTTWCAGGLWLIVLSNVTASLGQDADDPKSPPPAERPGAVSSTQPAAETTGDHGAAHRHHVAQTQAVGQKVRPATQVSAEDVLREFQMDRPRLQPLLPDTPADESITRGPVEWSDAEPRLRMPDGFFLVDRAGRLEQDESWWVFTFVADNNPSRSPEPPMKLLPNQMLERMVRESQGATQSVLFVVSGEVTDFMGENYLLLRKLMRMRDNGNLSK